jgi:branched-chain amino acid transport system ATP-binding protein
LEAPEHASSGAVGAEQPNPLLEVKGLSVSYGSRPVLYDIDLQIAPGEVVAMFGHNGAGKTSLLNAIFGRVKPTKGSVVFAGRDVTSVGAIANVKHGMTLIPAERFVFADLTVLDNLKLGAYGQTDQDKVAARLEQIHEVFPIIEERKSQLAGTMSGGQQRMLSIGIALATEPRLLLLDEPSLGLSPALVDQMMETIGRLAREDSLSVLLVEQNVLRTLPVVNRAYFLRSGRIILNESAEELRKRESYWELF